MLPTHYTPHSYERLAALHRDNDLVGLRFWLVIGSFIVAATLSNIAHKVARWTKCRSTIRQRRWSPSPRVSLKHLPLATLALWRRETRRHSVIADALHLGNHGTAMLIVCYFALNASLAFLKTAGDIDWQAHHCARLCFANLPLVIGLASKNNARINIVATSDELTLEQLLSMLTGIPYGSFAILHRWAGRTVLLLALVHASGRTYVNVPSVERGYKDWVPIKGHGRAVGVLMDECEWIALLPLSSLFDLYHHSYHRHTYALYLECYGSLSSRRTVMSLISLFFHRPQVQEWIIAGIAIYSFDLLWRTGKLFFNQVRTTFGSRSKEPVAWAEQLNEETIKISVRTRATWTAGAHAYLHLPLISTGGHPFSISSICPPLTQFDNKRPKESRIELLVRVRNGLTRKLHLATLTDSDVSKSFPGKAPEKMAGGPLPLYAWIEGPCGVSTPIGDDVDVLVLIAGGSGIAYTLPIMLDLVRRKRAVATLGTDRCAWGITLATQRVSLIWTIRSAEDVKIVEDHLKSALKLAPANFLSIKVYVTARNKAINRRMLSQHILPADLLAARDALAASGPNFSSAPTTAIPTLTAPLIAPRTTSLSAAPSPPAPDLDLCSGRPNIETLLEQEIAAAAASDRVGVACCGPPALTRSIEQAVTRATLPMKILRGEARRCVELTVEEFA